MRLPILLSGWLGSVLFCMTNAMPAWAQAKRGSSVDVALTANPDDFYRDTGPRSKGLSFGAAAGSVRFEFVLPAWHKQRRFPTPNLTVDEKRRALSFELLYNRNYEFGSGLGLWWLAGGGITDRLTRRIRVLRDLSTSEIVTNEEEFQRNHVTAVGGLDLEVAIARRIAIVSQLRVRMYPLGPLDTSCCAPQFLTAEPRVGVRWWLR